MKFAWVIAIALTCDVAFAAKPLDYVREIKPIFQAHCWSCHGALKQEGGLRLDTGAVIRTGGDNGPAVVPGKSRSSVLWQRISSHEESERMPPEGRPLTNEQLDLVRRWIDAGAVSPIDERPEARPGDHWAFQPPQRANLSPIDAANSNANLVDRLLAVEHERLQLKPAPPAEPSVLLRRVHLDLIGLPPTREELHAFLADPSPLAYQRTVDRLLASPQYGERWARHWMDIWRYSDWYGRRNVNDVRNSFPSIWRWRDWIVNSLNAGKSYDRMIAEMLAADEITPEDDNTLAATGFIVRNRYSLNYDQWMRDLVEHTGKAFLGLRLNCALCHDHKYDPISQREYFAMRAFFEPIEIRFDRVPGGPKQEKVLRYHPDNDEVYQPRGDGLPRVYEAYPDQKTYIYRGGDYRDKIEGQPPVDANVPEIFGLALPRVEAVRLSRTATYPGSRAWFQREEVARWEASLTQAQATLTAGVPETVVDPNLRSLNLLLMRLDVDRSRAERESAAARVQADQAEFTQSSKADELALSAARIEREANILSAKFNVARARIVKREAELKMTDDPKTKRAVTNAESGVAVAMKKLQKATSEKEKPSNDYSPLSPTYPSTSSGRRRALAAWIVDRRNPLTARVAVNHMWNWHFGRPLVSTVHDLGRSGAEPSILSLLDTLAVEFMESGWDLKRFHRQLVLSQTYRRSSEVSPESKITAERDPTNRYWWRADRRRMEAEVIRDSLLSVGGLLDRRLGGPDIDNTLAPKTPRRSLYFTRHPEDGGAMLFLAQFDAPDPSECYRRTETLVPQQALAMVNSELAFDVAERITTDLQNLSDAALPLDLKRRRFLDAACETILGRLPHREEATLCLDFLQRQATLAIDSGAVKKEAIAEIERRAGASLVRALLSHHDFVTVH